MRKNILYILLVLFLSSKGQNTDSLKHALSLVKDKSELFNKLSDVYKVYSEFRLSKKYADSALSCSEKHNNIYEKANAYINFGDYYYYTSKYDSSIFFYKKAANFQKKTGNTHDIAIIYNNIATVYFSIDEYQNAIEYYNESLKYKKESNDNASIAKGLNNLANVYSEIGDYEKAVNLLYESIIYCDKSKNKLQKSITLSNLAGLYKDWVQFDKALELYNEALLIKSEINDLDGKANILNNIGIVYKQKNEYDKAEKYFIKSKTIFNEIGNKKRYSIVNSNLGTIKQQNKEYNTAIDLFLESAEISKDINAPNDLAYNYFYLSRVYLLKNNYEKSEYYIKKCIKISEESQLNSINLEINKLLSELYEAKGNFKQALKYFHKYTVMKDSVFTSNNKKLLNELNTKYETDKKNKKIELLNVTADRQITEIKAKRQQLNLWIGISILGFILAIVSVYFFYNKKKLSEKLSKTLGEKDVLLREIHHRVKNNLQIISSLLNMQSRFLNDEKSKEIVNESQNRIKSMSLIHQKLYQEENLTGIETDTYFSELIDSLILSYGINKEVISIEIDIENILLDVDTAIPLGLILNEIISNAFKHGVDKEKGAFIFKFSQQTNDELLLFVKDNGKGIPDDFDIKKSKSYGMKLIQSLSKKLKAEIDFINNNGLEIRMKIRKFKVGKTQ